MIIIEESQLSYSTVNSSQSLDFAIAFPTEITIPDDTWSWLGSIDIVLIVRLDIIQDISPSGATRFHNPTEKTHGQVALIAEGYVAEKVKISYEKQQAFERSYSIAIANSRATTILSLSKDVTTKKSHYYSIAETIICGTAESQVAPAPTPSATLIQAAIPPGSICLTSLPGEEQFTQRDRFEFEQNNNIAIDLAAQSLPTGLSGILYPGKDLVVTTVIGYRRTENIAATPLIPARLVGDAPFPVYNYTCAIGVAVPSPSNLPCPPIFAAVTINGTVECPTNQD